MSVARYRDATKCFGSHPFHWIVSIGGSMFVLGLIVHIDLHRRRDSTADSQHIAVRQIANEGFLTWARKNMSKGCPATLMEVATEIDWKDTKDAWGHELIWFCGDELPVGAKGGFAVASVGPDGTYGTKDDILSWQRPTIVVMRRAR